MKFVRAISVILILMLATGPALAAACSASCLAAEMQAQMSTDAAGMAGMDHCQHQKSSQNQQQTKHGHCSMIGCQSVSAAQMGEDTSLVAPEFASTALPKFTSFGVSAELPPPIKPPA
jgi:hypothetical protein